MIETSTARAPITLNAEPVTAELRQSDGVALDADALSLYELERFLLDIRDEPEWRMMANRCADYYDHNQLSDDFLTELRAAGLPPMVINLIHPTINTVLGMEAKTRTDWKVDWEDESQEEVAQAIGKKMKEAERLSNADRAISDAYAGQVKAGLGWVEVGTNPDPFGYRYRVRFAHRREFWWDWKKREIDDWRYLVRRQRFDADQLRLAFRQQKNVLAMIDAAVEGGLTWQEFAIRMDDTTGLGQFTDIERALTMDGQEWLDTHRKQLSVFEAWYRRFVQGYVARVGETVIEIDQQNPRHMLAIAGGAMKPVLATYPKLRQAIFIGPMRVLDRFTPLPHRRIPYVPFFGYREDLTGAPYGLIRGMLSSQDDINARRSKMRAMMNARRAQVDSDALDMNYNTHEDAADEISRSDAYIVTNPNRKNANGVKIEDNADLAQGQAAVLQDAKNEIHGTSGVFPPMAGDQSGGLSGIAVNSLVEQGTQTLAEINDNYSWARREVGDQMMELVKADSLHPHNVTVGEGKAKRSIMLNKRVPAPNGLIGDTIENNVAATQLRLILEDVPSTPAWRQQQSAHLAEITKSLPPNLQAFIVPFYIEATDLKDRKQIAQVLRKQLGLPEDGSADGQAQEDPRIAQLMQQLQDVQQQGQQAVADLSEKLKAALDQLSKAKIQIANKAADIEVRDKVADAQVRASDAKVANETIRALADVERSEYPKGGGAENAPALEGAIEELIATVRASHQATETRFAALEKRLPAEAGGGIGKPPVKPPVAAPAAEPPAAP